MASVVRLRTSTTTLLQSAEITLAVAERSRAQAVTSENVSPTHVPLRLNVAPRKRAASMRNLHQRPAPEHRSR